MSRFVIDLTENQSEQWDITKIHGNLTTIRNWRNANQGIPFNQQTEIEIYWPNRNANNNNCITVVVQGNEFWVIGYFQGSQAQGNYISFGGDQDTRYVNLGNAIYASFNKDAVYNYLDILINHPGNAQQPTNFNHSGMSNNQIPNQMAFLMCVFIASEMVRNEFLEVVFLNPQLFPYKTWNNYHLLYTNWKKTLNIINHIKKKNDGPFAEVVTITLIDIWTLGKFVSLNKENLDNAVESISRVFKSVDAEYKDEIINIYADIMSYIACSEYIYPKIYKIFLSKER